MTASALSPEGGFGGGKLVRGVDIGFGEGLAWSWTSRVPRRGIVGDRSGCYFFATCQKTETNRATNENENESASHDES